MLVASDETVRLSSKAARLLEMSNETEELYTTANPI